MKRITQKDFDRVAESISSELEDRKKRRKDLEECWKEIDRQIEMKPMEREKVPGTEWMPRIELPLQAQALEVLTADADRLTFPEEQAWFRVHASVTDEYLREIEGMDLIPGVEPVEDPMTGEMVTSNTKVTQTEIEQILGGVLVHYHSKYNFRAAIGAMQTEAFKYGTYVGYVREVSRSQFTSEYRGVYRSDERMPVVIAGSIKSTYLDDSAQEVLKEGRMIAPSVIRCYSQRVADIQKAARSGEGWVTQNVKRLDSTKRDHAHVIEMEGDLIVPRSGTDGFVPNVIVTIADKLVVRVREIDTPFRPVVHGVYHAEQHGPYGVSPLMKGMPVQKMATEAANRLAHAVILNTEPPVTYDPNDQYLRAMGGPKIEPRALWKSISDVKTVQIGDPAGLMNVYMSLLRQYEELTGVSAPRLGAQTKSHQTAFAVDVEQTRGQTRTVDFVNEFRQTLTTLLHMELHHIKKVMPECEVYVAPLGGHVRVDKRIIPDYAHIEVLGAGSPIARREQEQKLYAALQMLLQIEPVARQLGATKNLDIDEVRRMILHQADPRINPEELFVAGQSGLAGGPQGGAAGIPPDPSILATAGLA